MQSVTKLLPLGHRNRPGYPMQPQGLLFHTTNNWDPGASDEMHGDYMRDQTDRAVSWHYTVDCDSRTQHIPENENAWHAGDGETGRYNRNWMGMEICCNHVKPGQPIDRETYDNAVASAADICSRHGFGMDQLQPHNVVYGKDCPHHSLFDRDQFKRDVFRKMGIKQLPAVVKERIYVVNGILKHCDGDYSRAATDVRYLKLPGDRLRFKFVARKGAKVSELVKEFGADFGTNGPFFWDGQVLGDAIADGQTISCGYGKMLTWHEFGVVGGKPRIGQLDKDQQYDMLVQAAPLLIEDGKLVYEMYRVAQQVPDDIGGPPGKRVSAQRTVYGIDDCGDLHIAVADGRTKWDKGHTLEEAALYMQSKGCIQAINFDGGSSSVIADQTGSLGQNKAAAECAVNHAILIWVQDAPAPQPPEDYKAQGVAWLKANGYTDDPHSPTETLDIGTFGAMMKKKAERGN